MNGPVSDAAYTHLSDRDRQLLVHTQRLAAHELAPIAAAGRPGEVNHELLGALAKHGLLAMLFEGSPGGPGPGAGPRAGHGVSAMRLCLLREALAQHCTEAETALALQGLGSYPILRAGRREVVDEWLPQVAAGAVAAGFALTEPDAGSDAAALALRATPHGDGFRLSGQKAYISNAPDAQIYSVFARTTDGAGRNGITAFAVPRDSPGLDGERLAMISPHPIGRLHFDNVRVPASHLLGEVDNGWQVAMGTLELFRPSVGAFAVGMAQAALDAAVAHAATRQAFGQPLRRFQGVTHQLADVATRLQAARLLVHSAATAYDAGAGSAEAAAMAKLFATETAQHAVDVAIQVHGARALEHGHLLEHLYREVRAPRIYEGTSEIQREIIARALFR